MTQAECIESGAGVAGAGETRARPYYPFIRLRLPAGRAAAVLARATSAAGGRALDLLLPPVCPITGERVERPGLLSAKGWGRLKFIDDPACARCGAPFSHDNGDGAECAACVAEPPVFDRARAAVVYDDASHKLIVSFKHSDRIELAPLLGGWLARAARPLISAGTILVPTPLHPGRLLARRYNQAALLAAAAAKTVGAELAFDALRRIRATPPQKNLSAEARRRNMAGAFAVRESRRGQVEGKDLVIVDDVMTTGATLSACARALKRAGAASVCAVVLARAMKGGIEVL